MSQIINVDAFVAFEAAGWSKVPDPYHRFFGPITALAADPLLDAAQVRAGTRVLDVATGPGYIAASATARGATVVGTDISPEILALARTLHPPIEYTRLHPPRRLRRRAVGRGHRRHRAHRRARQQPDRTHAAAHPRGLRPRRQPL